MTTSKIQQHMNKLNKELKKAGKDAFDRQTWLCLNERKEEAQHILKLVNEEIDKFISKDYESHDSNVVSEAMRKLKKRLEAR